MKMSRFCHIRYVVEYSRHFITLPKICKTQVVYRFLSVFCFVLLRYCKHLAEEDIGGYYSCCYVVSLFACVLMSLLRGAMDWSVIVVFPGETNLAI